MKKDYWMVQGAFIGFYSWKLVRVMLSIEKSWKLQSETICDATHKSTRNDAHQESNDIRWLFWVMLIYAYNVETVLQMQKWVKRQNQRVQKKFYDTRMLVPKNMRPEWEAFIFSKRPTITWLHFLW